jgi:hypothetical protein
MTSLNFIFIHKVLILVTKLKKYLGVLDWHAFSFILKNRSFLCANILYQAFYKKVLT